MDIIPLVSGNRMIRIGFGQYDGHWFLRFDLWWVGVRFT